MNNKYVLLENQVEPIMVKLGEDGIIKETVEHRYLYCRNCTERPINMAIRINRLDNDIENGRITCPRCGRIIDFGSSSKKHFFDMYGISWERTFY